MSQFWQKRATLNICCNVKRANIETAALFTRELRQMTIRMTSCSKTFNVWAMKRLSVITVSIILPNENAISAFHAHLLLNSICF